MRQRPERILLDPENNSVFDLLAEDASRTDLAVSYAAHKSAANPAAVPEKATFRNGFFAYQTNRYMPGFDYEAPKYKDGLLETETTYLDAFGVPITFVPEAEDGEFFEKSREYSAEIAFAGSKFWNCGWIQLTDRQKNGCYRALYDLFGNVLYCLPDGFEMSRLDHNGEAVLYRLAPDRRIEAAWKLVLKMHPAIMMYASNILYPWEDDKIFSDICPIEKDGHILIPFRSVFEHLFAEVHWDPMTRTVSAVKEEHHFTVTAGSELARFDGTDYRMNAPAYMVQDRLLVTVDAAEVFFGVTAQWNGEKRCLRFWQDRPYWDRWGKVENSYTTVPLSSAEVYPDYLRVEAENTVADIRSVAARNITCIAFMTDIHYTPCENDHIRLERTLNTYRHIASEVKLEGMVLGGDRIFEACKERRSEALKSYREHFADIRYFPLNGNHDLGGQWDGYVIKAENSANSFTKQDLFEGFYDHLKTQKVVFNEKDPDNQLYYYLDNPESKIRYVFLDSSDTPQTMDEKGKLVYDPIGWMAFSQKQIDWIANHALKLEEEGWTVLLFSHHVADPYQAKDYAMTLKKNRHTHGLIRLLDAYRKGEDLDVTLYKEHPDYTLRMQYPFSQYRRAVIAGVVMGHSHTDYVDYSETGIPFIHTASAYADDDIYRMDAPKRVDGTKTEILFDVITISRENTTLYLSRVGAGHDRVIKYL